MEEDGYSNWSRRSVLVASSMGIAALAGCTGGSGKSDSTTESPGEFELRTVNAPKSSIVGSEVSVTAILGNVGDAKGTANLQVSIGPLSQSFKKEIKKGEAVPVEPSVKTNGLEPGEYDLSVSVGGESKTQSISLFPNEVDSGILGRVTSTTGTSLQGSWVNMHIGGSGGSSAEVTDDSGYFSKPHASEVPYELTGALLKPRPGQNDGIPAIFDLWKGVQVEEKRQVLGSFSIPEGYWTQVRFVNGDGKPISNFKALNIRSPSGMGVGPRRYNTNEGGYIIGDQAEEPGITAPGSDYHPLLFQARPEDGHPVTLKAVYGSKTGEEITVEVTNPDKYVSMI